MEGKRPKVFVRKVPHAITIIIMETEQIPERAVSVVEAD
jgi:hypothetical protein